MEEVNEMKVAYEKYLGEHLEKEDVTFITHAVALALQPDYEDLDESGDYYRVLRELDMCVTPQDVLMCCETALQAYLASVVETLQLTNIMETGSVDVDDYARLSGAAEDSLRGKLSARQRNRMVASIIHTGIYCELITEVEDTVEELIRTERPLFHKKYIATINAND